MRVCVGLLGEAAAASMLRVPRAPKMINDNKAFPIVLAGRKEGRKSTLKRECIELQSIEVQG